MDIVERLEEHLRFNGKDQLSRDAKSAIERLREALRKIDAVKYYGPEGASMECDEMHEIARAALKEGK